MAHEDIARRNAQRAQVAQERRVRVAELYAQGYTQAQIARALEVPNTTIGRDITALHSEMQREGLGTLQQRINRSLLAYRAVQREAWQAYAATDPRSNNHVQALRTVLDAQAAIDELEGTTAPERTNAAAIAEAFEVMLHTLAEVGGVELQRTFLNHLRQRRQIGSFVLAAPAEHGPGA